MNHLSSEQLVDAAEGTAPAPPHLDSCEECRAGLAALRATMARVACVDVPEPSPLFWEQFSARVGDLVAAAGERGSATSGASGWRDRVATLGLRFGPRVLVPLSIGAAAAFALALLLIIHTPAPTAVAVPVPSIAGSAVPTEAVEGTAMLPPDDPALEVVADLGSQLDWDEIHDAGIVRHTGLVHRAVNELSPDERAELGKLLKQELAGGGS